MAIAMCPGKRSTRRVLGTAALEARACNGSFAVSLGGPQPSTKLSVERFPTRRGVSMDDLLGLGIDKPSGHHAITANVSRAIVRVTNLVSVIDVANASDASRSELKPKLRVTLFQHAQG